MMDENYDFTQSGLSTKLTVVNIYAPNNERFRKQFFKRIKFFINNQSNNTSNIILSGYINCKLDNLTDKSSKILKISHLRQLCVVDLKKNKISKMQKGSHGVIAADMPKSRFDYLFKYYSNSHNPFA